MQPVGNWIGRRVARRRSNTKVEVDAGTLKSILKVVDAVTVSSL
jgi:hypothetical protein